MNSSLIKPSAITKASATASKPPKELSFLSSRSERVTQLYDKRRKQVKHQLHAATKQVIDFAADQGVTHIVIGDITGIREEKDMGKVNNQKFHQWPFRKITQLLAYKAEDKGISTDSQEESYTSQCGPHSPAVTAEYGEKKNRTHRGLYRDGKNLYNADAVGAFNILKKHLHRAGLPATAVVGLDTPLMYRWNSHGFLANLKLAN